MRKLRLRLPKFGRKRKRGETSFSSFSFKTISSMTSKKDCQLVKHYKTFRERLALKWIKDKAYSGSNKVKKELYLSRLVVTLGILVCCAFAVAGFKNDYIRGLVSKSYFAKVETITIEGLDTVSVAEVYQASEIVRFQTSMLDIKEDDIEKSIEQLTWVENARVKLVWPSTVKVKVREQQPFAIVHTPNESDQFQYLNRRGKLFTEVAKGDDMDFPVVTGLGKLDADVYDESLEQILLFLKKVARNNPVLPIHSVSEVHVNEKGQLVVYLVDHAFPIYFGEASIDKAYKYLVRILEDVYRKRSRGADINEIGYIQLDYMKDQVLVAENSSG